MNMSWFTWHVDSSDISSPGIYENFPSITHCWLLGEERPHWYNAIETHTTLSAREGQCLVVKAGKQQACICVYMYVYFCKEVDIYTYTYTYIYILGAPGQSNAPFLLIWSVEPKPNAISWVGQFFPTQYNA